ncbi:MAG: protoporphyrinogen oxidase [Pseudonocardiales bacterium]
MTGEPTVPSHVVVVGGGIAGLAAAYRLRRDCSVGTRVTVLDGARGLGGKLRTSLIEGVAVDEGAEMFLARDPAALDLARAVGLGEDLVHPVTGAASVVVGGALRPLPARTVLGVPADLDALAASGVLTPAGLSRVLAGAAAPGEAVLEDTSVGQLVRDRLGAEVIERLVDPLLGGVYAGSADGLSLHATVPALAAALRTPRSLVAAAQAALPPSAAGPAFATLRPGLGSLVDAVVGALEADVRTGLAVRHLARTGSGWRVTAGPVPDPTILDADAVVVAVPALPAARLLREVAPSAADELGGIGYASMVIVTLVYPPAPLPAGSGLLVGSAEGRAVKAVTFSSQKWAHLAGGPTVVRASIGRYGEEAALQCSDEELAALAATDLDELTGSGRRPIATRVTRWGGGLPQYAVGHLDRVRRIADAVARTPGLAVAGAAYGGVGIPACIRSGYAAAGQVAAYLGQSGHG